MPRVLHSEPARHARMLEVLHRTVSTAGEVSGERAQRLAQVEELFRAGLPAAAPRKAVCRAV